MITVSAEQLNTAKSMLKGIKDGVPRAAAAAINRAAEMSRTEITRIITRAYYVKARDVNATIDIRRASMATLTAEIRSRGTAIPLEKFRVGGNPITRLRRFPRSSKPVKVQVRRDSTAEPSANIFAAKSRRGGAFALYRRKGEKRMPIQSLFGPPIPIMMGVDRNFAQINARAQEILDRRFTHEIERLRKGWEGKRK